MSRREGVVVVLVYIYDCYLVSPLYLSLSDSIRAG